MSLDWPRKPHTSWWSPNQCSAHRTLRHLAEAFFTANKPKTGSATGGALNLCPLGEVNDGIGQRQSIFGPRARGDAPNGLAPAIGRLAGFHFILSGCIMQEPQGQPSSSPTLGGFSKSDLSWLRSGEKCWKYLQVDHLPVKFIFQKPKARGILSTGAGFSHLFDHFGVQCATQHVQHILGAAATNVPFWPRPICAQLRPLRECPPPKHESWTQKTQRLE